MTDFLDSGSLQTVMNRSGIHIFPSETEGFGHYISEALSTQSVAITTHAPPMNELVQEDFGFLADAASRIPIEYGECFQVGKTVWNRRFPNRVSSPILKKHAWEIWRAIRFCRIEHNSKNAFCKPLQAWRKINSPLLLNDAGLTSRLLRHRQDV